MRRTGRALDAYLVRIFSNLRRIPGTYLNALPLLGLGFQVRTPSLGTVPVPVLELGNRCCRRPPVPRRVPFGNLLEPQIASGRGHANGLIHKILYENRVPLVDRRLYLAGKRRDGHRVGRVERPAKEHARAVLQGDDD